MLKGARSTIKLGARYELSSPCVLEKHALVGDFQAIFLTAGRQFLPLLPSLPARTSFLGAPLALSAVINFIFRARHRRRRWRIPPVEWRGRIVRKNT